MTKNIILFLGAYVPLTEEGNIVIDSVLASCYTSFDHELAHIGMAPMHWFPSVVQCVFGQDNGFSVFAKIVKESCKSIMPEGQKFGNIIY